MKKTRVVLAVIVAAGVVWTGSAWYVGKEARRVISDGVAQANERVVTMLGPDLNSSHFRIEIRDYEQGIFSSSVRYAVHTVDSDGKPMEYLLQDQLQHGPFPLGAIRAGDFAPMLAYSRAEMVVTPDVREWFGDEPGQVPFRAETRVGFAGAGRSDWTFAPFEFVHDQRRVSFSGGHVQLEFTGGVNNNVGTGHFDRYSLIDSAAGEHLELRDISLDSVTRQLADRHVEHNSSAQVKSMAFWVAGDMKPAMVEGLDVVLSSTQRDRLLDAGIRYEAGRILVDDTDLGKMTAAASINRLDVPALTDLQTRYADMAREVGRDTLLEFDLSPEQQAQLQEALRLVLAPGPTLSVDALDWTNASGALRAAASVSLRDPGDVETDHSVQLLRELIEQADLELSVDRAMVVELFRQVVGRDADDREQAGELGGMLFDDYAALLSGIGLMTLNNGTLGMSLQALPGQDRVVLNGETLTTEQLMILALGLMLL